MFVASFRSPTPSSYNSELQSPVLEDGLPTKVVPVKSNLMRVAVLGLALLSPGGIGAQVTAELDGYWAEVARTVEEGDFQGYARLYHPDAVLVSLGSGTSYAIGQALAGWEQGFLDTREGRAEASVTFRFKQRLHDEATAHETGIFRYTLKPKDGNETVAMFHFEGLLVRRGEGWLMVMEYQKQPATEAEWGALKEPV